MLVRSDRSYCRRRRRPPPSARAPPPANLDAKPRGEVHGCSAIVPRAAASVASTIDDDSFIVGGCDVGPPPPQNDTNGRRRAEHCRSRHELINRTTPEIWGPRLPSCDWLVGSWLWFFPLLVRVLCPRGAPTCTGGDELAPGRTRTPSIECTRSKRSVCPQPAQRRHGSVLPGERVDSRAVGTASLKPPQQQLRVLWGCKGRNVATGVE